MTWRYSSDRSVYSRVFWASLRNALTARMPVMVSTKWTMIRADTTRDSR